MAKYEDLVVKVDIDPAKIQPVVDLLADQDVTIEGLGQANTELLKVLKTAVESLKVLPDVPLGDLEASIEDVVELLEEVL